MRFLWRWLRRLALAVLLIALILTLPVLRNETMCRGTPQPQDHAPIVGQTRPEERTFTTYQIDGDRGQRDVALPPELFARLVR